MNEAKLLKAKHGYILFCVSADGTEFNYRYATKKEAAEAAKKMGLTIIC